MSYLVSFCSCVFSPFSIAITSLGEETELILMLFGLVSGTGLYPGKKRATWKISISLLNVLPSINKVDYYYYYYYFRTFVWFVLVWNCRFPLPLGVWEGLRFVIVALPGLFSYLFFYLFFFIENMFNRAPDYLTLTTSRRIRNWLFFLPIIAFHIFAKYLLNARNNKNTSSQCRLLEVYAAN